MKWGGAVLILAALSFSLGYVQITTTLPYFMAAGGVANFTLSYLAVASLLLLGPSLLILSGISAISEIRSRVWWELVAGAIGLAILWSWGFITGAGSEVPASDFVGGVGIAFAVGAVLVATLRRVWLSTLIGALLAVPLLLRSIGDVIGLIQLSQFPKLKVEFGYMGFLDAFFAVSSVILWAASVFFVFWLRTRKSG